MRRQDGAKLGWNAWLLGRAKGTAAVEVALFELMQFQAQPQMPELPRAPVRPTGTTGAAAAQGGS